MDAQLNMTVALPKWAMESDDPYIARLREESLLAGVGCVREFFDEMLAAGAWHQVGEDEDLDADDLDALAARPSWLDQPDDLELRCLEAYAAHAAASGRPMPSLAEVRATAGPWTPGPEDVVLALEQQAEQELASEVEGDEAEREDDWGQESVRVDPELDAIGELARWAGRGPGDRPARPETRAPLATVLATVEAFWDRYSGAQRQLVRQLVGETTTWETTRTARFRDRHGRRRELPVPVRHRRISTLCERANHAEMQVLVEEALDRWEDQQAQYDEEAHPATDVAPAVQVSLDNQARFLNWVARGAQPAAPQAEAKGDKPWLSRPTYIHVLDHALQNGARTPREAHNRAYAADTLRLADRIVGCTDDGFQVVLNRGKGQTGTVPYADARVAWPHLPAAARARLKQLRQA